MDWVRCELCDTIYEDGFLVKARERMVDFAPSWSQEFLVCDGCNQQLSPGVELVLTALLRRMDKNDN